MAVMNATALLLFCFCCWFCCFCFDDLFILCLFLVYFVEEEEGRGILHFNRLTAMKMSVCRDLLLTLKVVLFVFVLFFLSFLYVFFFCFYFFQFSVLLNPGITTL